MKTFAMLLIAVVSCFVAPAKAEKITIAAAADLKFALDEIVTAFERSSPTEQVDVVYGSSGKFYAQLRQGAPFDVYFSADIAFPRALAEDGLAASTVKLYAIGRIVLWSAQLDATHMTLQSLADARIKRIAIANPQHAPYGQRAVEALRAAGLWKQIEPKLVYGENVAQAAHFVQTGNAQVAILALSLARSPTLARKGGYWLIPEELHAPLEQGFIVMRRAAGSTLAQRFADYVDGAFARAVLRRYGFALPGGRVSPDSEPHP